MKTIYRIHFLQLSSKCVLSGTSLPSKVSSIAVNSSCLNLTSPLKIRVSSKKDLEYIQIKLSYICKEQYGNNSQKPGSLL